MGERVIEQKIIDLVVEQLGCQASEVTPDARFLEDLGTDDLDRMEIIIASEDAFGIEIRDEEIDALKTVGKLADNVKKKLGIKFEH